MLFFCFGGSGSVYLSADYRTVPYTDTPVKLGARRSIKCVALEGDLVGRSSSTTTGVDTHKMIAKREIAN